MVRKAELRSVAMRQLAALLLLGGLPSPAAAQSALAPIVEEGRILLDGRLRFELADQDGSSEDATGLTGRLRFGFETGTIAGFTALVEGDFTRDLGVNDFNSTVNGKTGFPVIADPDSERLNRLQLSYQAQWEGLSAKLTAGRQRIKLDNDRFIGNVGFRQNEQTYDAVRLALSPLDGLTVDYSYLWQVNRIFGSKSPAGEVDADSHLINAAAELPWGTLSAYVYLLDLDGQLAGAANQTYGVRFHGQQPVTESVKLLYEAEFANQMDYADSAADFDLLYANLRGGLVYRGFRIKAGFELLEGDGNRGFATPLATLHAFQGFADVFLTTPAQGIEDIVIEAQYELADLFGLGKLRLAAWYHDYGAERGPGDLGEEIDWGVFLTPVEGVTVSLEYADFHGAPERGDLRRFWTTISLQY